jgi:hypothetical protein
LVISMRIQLSKGFFATTKPAVDRPALIDKTLWFLKIDCYKSILQRIS